MYSMMVLSIVGLFVFIGVVIICNMIADIREDYNLKKDEKAVNKLKHELMIKYGLSEQEARDEAEIIYYEIEA